MISIKKLQKEFEKKYPTHKLNQFLLQTPETLSEETFLILVNLWLKIINEK